MRAQNNNEDDWDPNQTFASDSDDDKFENERDDSYIALNGKVSVRDKAELKVGVQGDFAVVDVLCFYTATKVLIKTVCLQNSEDFYLVRTRSTGQPSLSEDVQIKSQMIIYNLDPFVDSQEKDVDIREPMFIEQKLISEQ